MNMASLLLSGLVSFSVPLQFGYADQTIVALLSRKASDLSSAQYRADNRAKIAAIDGAWVERTAGSADPGRDAGPPDAVLELRSFAFYALSRGKGLSEDGRRALEGFRELLRNMKAEGHVVEVSDTRIGIEGETRVCAKFASAELAGKAWTQLQQLSAGADLVQLKPEKC
jgi:hypothetical protein